MKLCELWDLSSELRHGLWVRTIAIGKISLSFLPSEVVQTSNVASENNKGIIMHVQ